MTAGAGAVVGIDYPRGGIQRSELFMIIGLIDFVAGFRAKLFVQEAPTLYTNPRFWNKIYFLDFVFQLRLC